MDQPMQEPLGANKFTVQTQGRCYETKNVWLAATDGNTYMAHRAGHHLWLMLKKLPGSGAGGGGGGGGAGDMDEEEDSNLASFGRVEADPAVDADAGTPGQGAEEFKQGGSDSGLFSPLAPRRSEAETIQSELDATRLRLSLHRTQDLDRLTRAEKERYYDIDSEIQRKIAGLEYDLAKAKGTPTYAATPRTAGAGNATPVNGRAGTSGALDAFFGGDSSSAPPPTDDYWQWLPVITRGEKPSIKDLIGAGGVVGSVIHVGTLQRPLQGIDRPDRSYYQDAQYVAGLESSDEYVVAEQSLPCAEVLLC